MIMRILSIIFIIYSLLGIATFIWCYFISPDGTGWLYNIIRAIIWPDVWFDLGIGKTIMGTMLVAYVLKVSIRGR